jgi:hypothetical protein
MHNESMNDESTNDESAATPAISAAFVSRLIATYLDPRKETEAADEAEDLWSGAWAAEYLVRPELEAIVELIGGDDVYPGMTFELAVQFGIEAAFATLNSRPQLARDTVRELLADLKADFHSRMDSARRSKRLKAV